MPVALAVAAILAAIGVTWTFSAAATKLEGRLESIERTLADLRSENNDRWRREDMAAWADLLQARHPELKIPSVSK